MRIARVASLALFSALLTAQQPVGAQTTLKNPCGLRFSLLGGKKPAELLSGVVFDAIPAEARQLAQIPRPATSSIVYQVPLSDVDYKAVFNTPTLTTAEKSEIDGAKRLLSRAAAPEEPTIRSADGLATFLKNTKSQNVILVGHNEDGNFAFLDGTRSFLWRLSALCAEAAKNCIFISCRSKDYLAAKSQGVSRDLTLAEGIYIADKLDSWLKGQRGQITDLDLATFASAVETRARLKFHVAYIALNGCGAAGTATALYVYIQGIRE